MSGALRSAATCRKTPRAFSDCGATTTGTPRLMIPAFSLAISSTVSPSVLTWSRLIWVMAQISGATTLVASSLPPSPTSTTWKSAPSRVNQTNAIAVSTSKKVTSAYGPVPTDSTVGHMSSTSAAKSSGSIGSSPTRMRSTVRCR